MEPLKIILLIISQSPSTKKIQTLAQQIEQLIVDENLGHIQNLITSEPVIEKIEKKIEQMTNTNCEVLIILNFTSLIDQASLPHEKFINHKLVLSYFTDNLQAISEQLPNTLKLHQKAMERSFGCKKGCL